MHEDLEFPAIAAGDKASQGAVISFTLSGNGGPSAGPWAGYFPSSAYGRLTAWSVGLVGTVIHISALGKSPQDGFTEYQGYPYLRPRWGDYGSAVYVPGAGFYFATEYIEHPNCGTYAFSVDPSCGATRDPYANFGTSIDLSTREVGPFGRATNPFFPFLLDGGARPSSPQSNGTLGRSPCARSDLNLNAASELGHGGDPLQPGA